MTQDEVIEMANKAGCISYTKPHIRAVAGVSMTFAQLEAFAKLVEERFMDNMIAHLIAHPSICRQIIDAGLLASNPAGFKYRKKTNEPTI